MAKIWKGIVAGCVGGLVGAWAMNEFQALVSKAQSSGAGGQQQLPESEPATVKAAERVSSEVLNCPLADEDKGWAGEVAHYAMGVGSGMAYGVATAVRPEAAAGFGLLFGTVLWGVADEGVVPALGLAKGPMEYPLSSHAYALASHLVYGVTTEAVRRAVLKAI